ncbi:MAG: response regulator transcription factor [Candidatus Dormibacteraceae bacterium]
MPFTPPEPLPTPPAEVIGAKILVVDDEVPWQTILATDLQLLGYQVLQADDAESALTVAINQPELAIIDLMLPEPLDGRALVEALRRRNFHFPVLFYTAYPVIPPGPNPPGVLGCMSKSVDRAELYSQLPEAILAHRKKL